MSKQKLYVSDGIIKTLAVQLLKEQITEVKEVIAAAIGGIGLPEAQPCLESLIRYLS